jgi:uncharacterized RDD family membrane protein YckC
MSDFPGPDGGQEAIQPPQGQPYPASAPTQFNPQFNPPPWQGQQNPQPPPGYPQPPPGYSQPPPGFPQPPPSFPQAPPVPAGYGYGQPGGQPVPAGLYFDQQSGLMLPQGTVLASSGRRIGAFFLAIPLAIVTLGIGYVIWGLIAWGNGQTPTQQVLGMRCYRPETNRIAGFWWMALREVVGGIADSILYIITELISFIFMLTRPDRRALHDLVAGTVVLHDPNKVLSQ